MPLRGSISVDELFCKGCGLCVTFCPRHALRLAEERRNPKGYHPAELLNGDCTGCATCAVMCPEAAIVVFREGTEPRSVKTQGAG